MGYFLKNRQLQSGSTAVQVPTGTTAERPATPNPIGGAIRFNIETALVEYYDGTDWLQFAPKGSLVYVVDDLGPGDGTTVAFTMSTAATGNAQVQVFVDGVYQTPTTNYGVSGTTLTFTSAPPLGTTINVNHTST